MKQKPMPKQRLLENETDEFLKLSRDTLATISQREKAEAAREIKKMQQAEENRKRFPWVASFLDELRAAGFEGATVKKIHVRNA